MRALFDTNILIDYLNGLDSAKIELARYKQPMISQITWIEIMVGTNSNDERAIRSFLFGFMQVSIDTAVAECAVSLRQQYRLGLPDAIVWASAQVQNALLVTRDIKDFRADNPGVRVPYQVAKLAP